MQHCENKSSTYKHQKQVKWCSATPLKTPVINVLWSFSTIWIHTHTHTHIVSKRYTLAGHGNMLWSNPVFSRNSLKSQHNLQLIGKCRTLAVTFLALVISWQILNFRLHFCSYTSEGDEFQTLSFIMNGYRVTAHTSPDTGLSYYVSRSWIGHLETSRVFRHFVLMKFFVGRLLTIQTHWRPAEPSPEIITIIITSMSDVF